MLRLATSFTLVTRWSWWWPQRVGKAINKTIRFNWLAENQIGNKLVCWNYHYICRNPNWFLKKISMHLVLKLQKQCWEKRDWTKVWLQKDGKQAQNIEMDHSHANLSASSSSWMFNHSFVIYSASSQEQLQPAIQRLEKYSSTQKNQLISLLKLSTLTPWLQNPFRYNMLNLGL